jgi:hypothetical protein
MGIFDAITDFGVYDFEFAGLLAAALTWPIWCALLILKAYERGSESVGMKLHLYLLAATLIELLVSIPIHIVCERLRGPGVLVGSDLAISIGVSVLVVAVGPAAYLRYRKPRRAIANPI